MFVAIMGYGVVGSGVANCLKQNYNHIKENSVPEGLEVRYILDLRDFPGDPFESLVIHDLDTIIDDPEVKIVVETMGGLHPAYEFVTECLKSGKSVVTSNKELVAMKGYELLLTARENNVNFMFEASVGGGIPLIRPIISCLAANEITEVAGILNGTTNFILTKMINENMPFDEALKIAQSLGYAEKDPTADVEGIDACRKICILAALCFGRHVYPDSVHTEGIRNITLKDVEYAKKWGGVIKLIASASKTDDGHITASVSPAFVRNESQLAGVNGVFNAALLRGNAVGDVVFYGQGAGSMPTASAVAADVIDCAKHTCCRKEFGWKASEEGFVIPYDDFVSPFYIRGNADAEKVASSFSNVQFIENAPGEFALITPPVSVKELKSKLDGIDGIGSVIRVTDY